MDYYAKKRHSVKAERVPALVDKENIKPLELFMEKCNGISSWWIEDGVGIHVSLGRECILLKSGDWIVIDDNVVKVMSNSKFKANFEPVAAKEDKPQSFNS